MKQSFKPHLFLYSIFSPVDGFFIVLGHPKMWIASILPIILNFLLFVISIVLVVLIGQTVNDWSVIEDIDSKIHVLSWILNVIWIFLGLLFAYFIFINLSLTVGSPFYGYLAEATFKILKFKYEDETPNTLSYILYDIRRSLSFELKKLILTFLLFALSFPINAIPVIGVFVFIIVNLLFNIFVTALDFFDCGLERIRPKFRWKAKFILKNYPYTFTFGLIAFLLVTIPFVNLFAMPFLVVASAKLYTKVVDN